MFNKKTRRIFRQRKGDSSDEEEMTGNGADGAGSEKAAKVVPNKPSRLGHCRGISCSSKRESAPSKLDESDGEDVETATMMADDEEDGKDNDVIKKKTSTVLSFSDDKEPLEPEFKLKRSLDKAVFFQVRKKEAPPARNNHNAEPERNQTCASVRQDDDTQASPQSSHQSDDNDEEVVNDDDDDDDDEVDASSSSSSSKCSYSAVKPVVIPNARMIEAAKRQRRNIRAHKEFIPLDKDGRSSLGSTPEHCLKEEMQEEEDEDRVNDDDDDDPDDHDRRIEFAPRFKSVKERIAEKLGESVGCLSGSDEEEQELWEETQIEKGVKRWPGGQSPSGSESSSYSSSSFQRDEHQRHKKKSAGLKIPKMLPSVTVSMVKRRIAGKLDSLKEVHSARRAQLSRMEGDAESAKTSVESLEEGSSEKQLKFYRDMTLFAHNLVECLQEKTVEINSLELELHTLLSSQMVALCAQRQQKIQEHAQHLQQFSSSDSSTNGADAERVEGTCHKPVEDCDIPEDAPLSSEEEEHLEKETAAILLKSQEIFSDVHDDFHDVKRILSRFEEWRSFYSDSYHTAYISLCLPKLLNPIIRQQLLGWNPLKDTNVDFEKLPWFTAVETFCHGHGHEELENIDREMLSNVIERTVIPKITAFVELVWDPMSLRQSACLTELCHRLREDYSIFEGEQSKPVTTLTKAVIGRLKNCVDEDVFIPLYPKKLIEDRLSPQSQFRNQQFWMAIKLLGNMGKWDPLLPDSALKELMLDKLVCRYLMITLGSQTLSNNDIRACKRIADSLPTSWFRGKNECLPQLQSFKNHLVQKAHDICKHQPPEAPDTRLTVVEVLQILSRIRCHDAIMSIAEKYHCEDVIYSHQLLNQETE
ncbi:GC-rich sequence DNA-binding factor 2 isoform X1 [Hippocampus zosterae]|uniref:GC-rich sequence DNA-binding factor 2 isoform X1 n=1 Tax=Hippocampus zosterae TaxID=109293 RepID=UPI00223E7A1B|nr:GC-rich sequence DNA-binding factor 2 isoform X1 [Hippocampus zosterae]